MMIMMMMMMMAMMMCAYVCMCVRVCRCVCECVCAVYSWYRALIAMQCCIRYGAKPFPTFPEPYLNSFLTAKTRL